MPVIAAVGVWVTLNQFRLAREKNRRDEFDRLFARRMAVYQATRDALAGAFDPKTSDDDVRVYGLVALEAQFLFDPQLFRYLREVHRRVAMYRNAQSREKHATDVETKKAHAKIKDEQLTWLVEQGDEASGFATRFEPYLRFEPKFR